MRRMGKRKKVLLIIAAIGVACLVTAGAYVFELWRGGSFDAPVTGRAGIVSFRETGADGQEQPGDAAFYVVRSKAANGMTIAEIYAEPVNVPDGKGGQNAVDTGIVESGSTLRPKSAGFGLTFSRSYLKPVTLIKGKAELEFTPVAISPAQAIVKGNKAVYRDTHTGTDLERTVLAEGVKETYILKKAGHPTWFDITLKTKLTPKKEPDGSIGYYDGDARVAFSPVPFLVDKKGRHRRAAYALSGSNIRLNLPEDMSGLKYPVRLDPTTYFESDASDGYIGYDDTGTAYVYAGDPYLEVASDNGLWTAESWLKFPLTGIGGTITSATLNVYYNERTFASGSLSIPVDHVPDFGVLNETDWAVAPLTSNIDPAPVTSSTLLGWHSLDVTPYVQDDLTNFRSVSAYRLRVNGAGSWYARFSSSEAMGYKPYLRIVYGANETAVHSQISDPVDQSFLKGAGYEITGTATPGQDGVPVTLVEVSTDAGATWNPASGTDNWSYDWTLPADGNYIIKTRATSSAVETPNPGIRVTVDNTPPVAAIISPLPNQEVSAAMPITGTATDDLFDQYLIEYSKDVNPAAWIKLGDPRVVPVAGGTLADVNTYRLDNDTYTFKVTVSDKAGNTSSASVIVAVNNGIRPGTPHGNYQVDTDLCALCHGTHTGIFAPGILRFGATKFQSQLCYTCHDGAGSIYDVATEFDTGSAHHPIQDTTYEGDPAHTLDCSDCHDPHGSEETVGQPYPRILRAKDGAGAKSYQGNQFCYACHGAAGSIKDMRYFEDNNGHNNTDPNQTQTVADPASGTKIKCVRCHEPHGSQQANLRRETDKNMCGASGCHPETPYTIRNDNEVVTGVGYPDTRFSQPFYAGVRVFSQDTFNTPPVALKGPKEYRASGLTLYPRLRAVAVGDATNDGRNDIVATIADGGSSALAVWARSDDGYSFKPANVFSTRGGYGVAVGDVNLDGSNETVVATIVATIGAPYEIKVLNILGNAVIGSTSYATGGTNPRKVAIGDITGDGLNDVVVTNYGSNNVTVFKQSAGILTRVGPVSAGGTYTYGLAIGDVNADGKNEVVVANQGYENQSSFNQDPPYSSDNVTVFTSDAAGNLTLAATLDNGTATAGWDVAVGDVLDGSPGNEIVAVGHPLYPSGRRVNGQITVFNLNDAGDDNSARVYDAGATDSKGVAVGDANGDGQADVVVLNGAAVSVFSHGAADLTAPAIYSMAGMNTVGIIDEPGPVAIGDVVKSHPFGHRVEVMGVCTGCHDPHSVTKAAPVWGASGVEPVYGPMTTYTLLTHVVKDYQLCFKCHSGASVPLVGTRNVAEEMNPNNASYHAVMAAGKRTDMPAGSFVGSWNQTSRLLCGDCHGKDALAPQQMRHGSANAYFLKKTYAGLPPSDSYLLCYTCHSGTFYGPGAATPAGNYAWNRSESEKDHRLHSNLGINCATCHDMHGSATTTGMIRPDMSMTGGNVPGVFYCTVACH